MKWLKELVREALDLKFNEDVDLVLENLYVPGGLSNADRETIVGYAHREFNRLRLAGKTRQRLDLVI